MNLWIGVSAVIVLFVAACLTATYVLAVEAANIASEQDEPIDEDATWLADLSAEW
ncbi:MAG: hypothetical protein ABIW81_06195 [Terrimesophilobacter sp.]